jgi:Bacterial regulatory proteins, lacI family
MKRSQNSSKSAATRKIDIRGVAARARVSIATVSRTVNHVPTVDPVLQPVSGTRSPNSTTFRIHRRVRSSQERANC